MIQTKANEPYVSLWFGNFFELAYSDREYIDRAMQDIAGMGFNTILLDSKSWQDFWERYEGKAASPYVKQQEYMMKKCAGERAVPSFSGDLSGWGQPVSEHSIQSACHR